MPRPRVVEATDDQLDFDFGVAKQHQHLSLVPGELGTSKVKLSTVLDQGDDSEIRPISNADLQNLMEHWKANFNDGEEPVEEEEATGDQVSALSFRLRSGGTPFVDFGVWRPNAVDLGRSLKFAAYFLSPTGEFQRKELVGPTTFADWSKSWRVFAFAMEMLGAASRTRLAKYHAHVAALNDDYPNLWWLVSLADIKMRKTYMERIRRRLAGEHAELTQAGLKSAYDVNQPWDSVFREAAKEPEFWNKEVERKVVQFTTAQRSRPQLVDPGFGSLQFASLAGAGKSNVDHDDDGGPPKRRRRTHADRRTVAVNKALAQHAPPMPAITNGESTASFGPKGKGKGKDVDTKVKGKFIMDGNRKQICWAWNKSRTGCQEPCTTGRAHVCEICRGTHRTVDHKA